MNKIFSTVALVFSTLLLASAVFGDDVKLNRWLIYVDGGPSFVGSTTQGGKGFSFFDIGFGGQWIFTPYTSLEVSYGIWAGNPLVTVTEANFLLHTQPTGIEPFIGLGVASGSASSGSISASFIDVPLIAGVNFWLSDHFTLILRGELFALSGLGTGSVTLGIGYGF